MELPLSLFLIIFHILVCSCLWPLVMVSGSYASDSMTARCHEGELSALLQFKNDFVIMKKTKYGELVNPTLESWKVNDHENGSSSLVDCCSWDGVECDAETGHVIALDLYRAGLYGSFINSNGSSSLFQLVHLQRLDLPDNDFDSSHIPYGFGLLRRLTHLDLSNSAFSGEVPWDIFTLTRLVSLRLGHYAGPDYPTRNLLQLKRFGLMNLVQNLTNLEELSLDSLYIPSPVPDTIANMSSLTTLSLLYTIGLYGVLPSKLFLLENLQSLVIGGDDVNLTSRFPEFNTSSRLQELRLRGIMFENELPESMGNLNSLTSITIKDCGILGGSLPSSLGNLTELTDLYLSRISFDAQNFSSLSWLGKLTQLNRLILEEMNLQGQIPSSIGKLSNLYGLSLTNNQLSGSIPTLFMNLTQLQIVYLYANQLSGGIPSWISNMTRLNIINFSFNRFRGTIPSSSFSQLQNLRELYLYRAQLSGIVELDMFLKLKNLENLEISSNNLTCRSRNNNSTVAAEQLPQFILLGLSSCNLSEFPSLLRNQNKLTWLDLSKNNIHGQVPEWISKISINSLRCLNFSSNFLTGFDLSLKMNLPWKNIYALDLTSNLFRGPLPIPPASIESYLLSNNNLNGVLPFWVCGLTSLKFLDLSSNDLSGKLPPCLRNFSSTTLSVMNLQQNRFNGTIPRFCASGGTQLIKMISLRHNQLQGRLPRSLSNCSMLEFIDIGNNQINDTFPSWLGSLTELEVLILNNNKFHGGVIMRERVHSAFFAFHKLRIIEISHNALTGLLPEAYFLAWSSMRVAAADQTADRGITYMQIDLGDRFGLSYSFGNFYDFHMTVTAKGLQLFYSKVPEIFKIVDLSSNMFEGEIPDVIGGLRGIHSLNLSHNLLAGGIPSSMGNLTELESLDLSHNRLKGEIPEELAKKLNFLSRFDVSYNDLTGPIPKGQQFNTFPETSFEGNLGLCGDVIPKKCGGSNNAGPTSSKHEEEDSDWWTNLHYIIVAMGCGCGLVIGVVLGNEFATRRHGRFAAFIKRRMQRRS